MRRCAMSKRSTSFSCASHNISRNSFCPNPIQAAHRSQCSAGGTRMWYLSHFAPLRHCAIVHSTCPVPRLLEELEAVKLAEAEQGKRDSLQAWYRKRFRAVRQCLPPPECWIQYRCRLIQIFGSLDHDSLCELCVFQVDCC
jgi:hypothetical protein